jgi:hypothetical protein
MPFEGLTGVDLTYPLCMYSRFSSAAASSLVRQKYLDKNPKSSNFSL